MIGYSFIAGHIIVGLYFLSNAYSHLFKSSSMVGYAASKKVPSPKLAIIGSGILLLIAGLSFVAGMYMFYGILAALIFMIPVTIMMHGFWSETDPMARMTQRIAFMKNVAIIGFLLMLL